VRQPKEELAACGGAQGQLPLRRGAVAEVLARHGCTPKPDTGAGGLDAVVLVEMVRDGANPDELRREILTHGGLYAHAGTNDLRVVERRYQEGDEASGRLIQVLAYNVAKAAGGMARSALLVEEITRRVRFLAPVLCLPQVDEIQALAKGAELALCGRAPVLDYKG